MASTTPLALPYPTTADAPNGPAQIQSLATAAQVALGSVTAALQEGVIDAGSFEVTQASGGAGMVLDVASNVGSGCFVDDDGLSPARVARYYAGPTAAKSTVTVATAHATLPRVDAVVVSMAGVVSIVTGTATSGATLDNARDGSHGGAPIPSDSLYLADALVPATDTTISNSQIRDRRKWARGGRKGIVSTGSFTRTSTTVATIDPTLVLRLECAGVPLIVTLDTTVSTSAVNKMARFDVMIDGLAANRGKIASNGSTAGGTHIHMEWEITPAAGSHTFAPGFASVDGSTTIAVPANGGEELIFRVREDVRQDTANNTTTSG